MENDKTKYNYYIDRLKAQLIIDPELVVAAITALDFNVEQDKIIPAVYDAQRIFIEPILGTSLYRKLQEQNPTFEYQMLAEDFVLPCLVHYSMVNLLPQMSFNVAQGGIYKHYSTDSETITDTELDKRTQSERIKAEEFQDRLYEFLETNEKYYPEYTECIAGGIPARRKDSDYLGSWYLGDPFDLEDILYGVCSDDSCPADDGLFVQHFYWGNNDELSMGFDPTTLQSSSSVKPNEVIARPLNDYYWVVGDEDFDLTQVGMVIPHVDFSNPNADSEIFVKGVQDGKTWFRVTIKETYEQDVIFGIK